MLEGEHSVNSEHFTVHFRMLLVQALQSAVSERRTVCAIKLISGTAHSSLMVRSG